MVAGYKEVRGRLEYFGKAAAILVLTASTAGAEDWYILSMGQDRCRLATEVASLTGVSSAVSPSDFADLLRREGKVPGVRVIRDAAGKISSVAVVWGKDETFVFTS